MTETIDGNEPIENKLSEETVGLMSEKDQFEDVLIDEVPNSNNNGGEESFDIYNSEDIESKDMPSKQLGLIKKPYIKDKKTRNNDKKSLIDKYKNGLDQENVKVLEKYDGMLQQKGDYAVSEKEAIGKTGNSISVQFVENPEEEHIVFNKSVNITDEKVLQEEILESMKFTEPAEAKQGLVFPPI